MTNCQANMSNNDNIFMAKYSIFNPSWLVHRDMGFQTPVGYGDAIAKSQYCGMMPVAIWKSDSERFITSGGVFNLEFSPEGSLLVAACEKRAIQIFDPLTHKLIHTVLGAHMDCVNCVKFLDARMFATCSDDTTIALWDVRNLKKKIRSLFGHSKWVKNIEFSVKDKLLVTSGLDGSIYTWDINSYTETNLIYQRVFHTSSLMRCRLSPDARQMVLSTTGGLIIIIHDLNLETLGHDLHGFKPNLYRLMQMSNQLIPIAAMYDHLFDINRKENRVEFISDFPQGNDAEVVSALQIHPQGWCALSRNISHGDVSEWTCIHDIQPKGDISKKSTRDVSPSRYRLRPRSYRNLRPSRNGSPQSQREAGASSSESEQPNAGPSQTRYTLVELEHRMRSGGRAVRGEEPASEAGPSQPTTVIIANTPADPPASVLGRGIQNDMWEASITLKQHRLLQEIYSRGHVRPNFNMQRITGVNTGITPPTFSEGTCTHTVQRPSTSGHSPRDSMSEEENKHFIKQNVNRLLYHIEETNEGKGFIKELCYSPDGRIVCSPYGRGMRLLAVNKNCSELNHCVEENSSPQSLVEVGQNFGYHTDLVVSSKFSPRHHLLVTGCLEGKIVWYQPHSGEA